MSDETDFTKEDQGKYRHPDFVGGFPYTELEERVFAAIDAGYRTLPRLKEHAGLERSFDLSWVIDGMLMDEKIRKCENGTFAAFYRYDQMPRRFWNAGDGTIATEFDETFRPTPKTNGIPKGEDWGAWVDRPQTAGKRTGSGRAPIPITPAEMEAAASTLKTTQEIANAVGYKAVNNLYQRFKQEPALRDAYDRGRKVFAERMNGIKPGEAAPGPAEIETKEVVRETEPQIVETTQPADEMNEPVPASETRDDPSPKGHSRRPVEAPDGAKVEELAAKGYSLQRAAGELGISFSTLRRFVDGHRGDGSAKEAWERGRKTYWDERHASLVADQGNIANASDNERQPQESLVILGSPPRPVVSPPATFIGMDLPDMVNHPPHYTSHPSGIECIDVVEHYGFNIGNAMKYLWRAEEKGAPLEDLRKAAWYIEREIQKREKLMGGNA